MANAEVVFENLTDDEDVVLSVTGVLPSADASRLRDEHVGNAARVNGETFTILADFGSATALGAVALLGLGWNNLALSPTFRVRGSSVDASGLAGDVFDSGVLSGLPNFSVDYRKFVYLRASASPRYLRIDLVVTGASYIDVGRLVVGVRRAFEVNFTAPWSRSPVRRSQDVEGIGGQLYTERRQGYWRLQMPFEFTSEADANGFLEDMAVAVVNDGHLDMLFIRDPDSSNLPRDCEWGYHEGDWPRSQETYTDPPKFRVPLNIRQRM